MRRILHRHALKLRQQRRKLIRVSQKIVDVFRLRLTSNSPSNLIAMASGSLHVLRRELHGFQNVLISGAAAGVAGNGFAHVFFVGLLVR